MNPFEIATRTIFNNPHFTERFTIPGKGSFTAVRGQETRELIQSRYGTYEDISAVATVQKREIRTVGLPKKGDLCYFDRSPDKHYKVHSTVEDSACQTVDILLEESLR